MLHEMTVGVLGDLLQDLEQGIAELPGEPEEQSGRKHDVLGVPLG